MSSTLNTRPVGMIRIYMKPNDNGRTKQAGIFRKTALLYRELVEAAKADGIMNAIAHNTHYGAITARSILKVTRNPTRI